jgi:hypothetical protein
MPDAGRGFRTLGEIGARTSMLAVACSRYERRGHYRLDALTAATASTSACASSSPG